MPLRSMTAYGFGEYIHGGATYSCEIRTLNSRFLEPSARLPRSLISLEAEILSEIKRRLGRGKVDAFFEVTQGQARQGLPTLDRDVLRHYVTLLADVAQVVRETQQSAAAKSAGMPALSLAEITAVDLVRLDGVLQGGGHGGAARAVQEKESHGAHLMKALETALTAVERQRESEGATLGKALQELVDELARDRKEIAGRVGEIRAHVLKNYERRLTNLMAGIPALAAFLSTSQTPGSTHGTNTAAGASTHADPDKGERHVASERRHAASVPEERLMIEIGILTEKSDIEEEITRLASHEVEFAKLLQEGDGVGRKLDFLCQEMHREVNTMSAKLIHLDSSQTLLRMKQTVERLRQQVQNIE